MIRLVLAIGALVVPLTAVAQTRIGEVSTTFRFVGPNDKVLVERYDDPKVDGVACYVSRADTGGLSGAVGLAEDPSRFSIACRAVGPVMFRGEIDQGKKGEEVFSERTSFIFKSMRVTRFFDTQKQVLVYLVWSTKLIDGSPYNAVSVVPLKP